MKKGKLAALLALGMLLSTGTAYGAEDAPYNPGPMLDGIQISSRTAGRGGKISVAADAWTATASAPSGCGSSTMKAGRC